MKNSLNRIFTPDDFLKETSVSRETFEKLEIYVTLLTKWQKRMNLISHSTVEDMWRRHFYDSAQLATFIEKPVGESLRPLKFLDIGSGAGFPGLVLAIMGMGEFHMIESNGKKATFMNQVIRETGASAIVHNERVEEMKPFEVDYITSRACASLTKLLELGQNFIKNETICLFLKGEIAEKEIQEAQKLWHFQINKYTSKTESLGSVLRLDSIRVLTES